MNIKEGSKRLSLALTWVVVICFWIPCSVALIIIGIMKSGDASNGLLLFFMFIGFLSIVSFAIKDICHKVGMWVIKGFALREESE